MNMVNMFVLICRTFHFAAPFSVCTNSSGIRDYYVWHFCDFLCFLLNRPFFMNRSLAFHKVFDMNIILIYIIAHEHVFFLLIALLGKN